MTNAGNGLDTEQVEVEAETGLEADGDARGRRWRMPNTGGTMRPEHGDEMGCCSGDIAVLLIAVVSLEPRYCGLESRLVPDVQMSIPVSVMS